MDDDLINPFGTSVTDKVWQCPACESWQLHCEMDVALQWVKMTPGDPDGNIFTRMPLMDAKDFEAMIESIFREHVARECPHPRLILEMLREGRSLGL